MSTMTQQRAITTLDALCAISREFRAAWDLHQRALSKRRRWTTSKSARARLQRDLDSTAARLTELGAQYQRLGGERVIPAEFMLHPKDLLKIRNDVSAGAPSISAAIAGRRARVAAMTAYGRAQGLAGYRIAASPWPAVPRRVRRTSALASC